MENVDIDRPGVAPIPIGMEMVFGCVRAVVFRDEATNFPSILGSGFFLKLFGDVFFITARHVIKSGYGFAIEDIAIQYQKTRNDCVPFCEHRVFSSANPDDTDHADIVIYRVDPSRVQMASFGAEEPFDIVAKMFVTEYRKGMELYFYGLSPSVGDYDYENGIYKTWFSGGDVTYLRPAPGILSVHVGTAEVNDQCPDFDGLSGSPLFSIDEPDNPSSSSRFAGMLLRGTLSSKLFHFMDSTSIYLKLLDFFLAGLSEADAHARLTSLMCRFYTEVRYGFTVQPYAVVRFVVNKILDVQLSYDARARITAELPRLNTLVPIEFPLKGWSIDSLTPGDARTVTWQAWPAHRT